MNNKGRPELGEPADSSDSGDIACVLSTVGERSTGKQEVRDQGVGNTLAGDKGTNSQQSNYFNETTGPRREMVVHAAQAETRGFSERALVASGKYGDPRVARTDTRDKDKRAVSTSVPRYEDDNLIFMKGVMENGTRLFMQQAGGSNVSCIIMEHVRALGMESQMAPRDVSRQYRVRGIGQEAGKGQVVRYDVWLSVAVQGRSVVDWETISMSPVGGSSDSLRVEGWFAGDLLYDHDVIPRVTSKQIVVQKKGRKKERVVVSLLSLAAVVQEVGQIQDDTYRTPVWHDMAKNMGAICGGLRASILRLARSYRPGL